VEEIEQRFLELLGGEGIAVATSSGRTALQLALRALRLENAERDEVIIPSYSCRGLLDPILACDLKPVFTDIGESLNMTAACLAPKLGPRTLAVVVAHLGGSYASDLPAIDHMTQACGAVLIEDACQALGGRTGDSYWGATSPMAIYSFGLGKNVMATAGGMLVSRIVLEATRRERARLGQENPGAAGARFGHIQDAHLRSGVARLLPASPIPCEAFASAYGYNRMSGLDSRLLGHQLAKLPKILEGRAHNARGILASLQDLPDLEVIGCRGPHVWTKCTIRTRSENAAGQIRGLLHRAGVETESMYIPLHLRGLVRIRRSGGFPTTKELYPCVFNVPVRPSLRETEIAHIAATLRHAALTTQPEGDGG
jgi:dTDP-4-amino-4,6-dideoxygalactose transaminase